MTEKSIMWTTGSTGDGASEYTQAETIRMWRQMFISDTTDEGVHKNYLNELEVTGVATPVSVNTGAALVYGFPYWNTASVDVAIPTPSSQTRVDYIVLRAGWSAQTVRITRIAGTEGAGAPSLTQSDGVTWDIPLATASITTGGVITCSDQRVFLHPNVEIETAMIADLAVTTGKINDLGVTTGKIAADAVTTAKIPNRTRVVSIPAVAAYNDTDNLDHFCEDIRGWTCNDETEVDCFGFWRVPEDFVSGLTIKAVFVPAGTGNIYMSCAANYGAATETYNTHTASFAAAAVAVTSGDIEEEGSMSLASAATGDNVALQFTRYGDNGSDTVGAEVYFQGWIASYTADS